MLCTLLKAKLHHLRVTQADKEYEGSLTIDAQFMEQTGLLPYERILCGNLANGHRFETYAIPGRPGSGEIILNGAVAHLGKVGDRITIMSYAVIEEAAARSWQPRVIVLGEAKAIVNTRGI